MSPSRSAWHLAPEFCTRCFPRAARRSSSFPLRFIVATKSSNAGAMPEKPAACRPLWVCYCLAFCFAPRFCISHPKQKALVVRTETVSSPSSVTVGASVLVTQKRADCARGWTPEMKPPCALPAGVACAWHCRHHLFGPSSWGVGTGIVLALVASAPEPSLWLHEQLSRLLVCPGISCHFCCLFPCRTPHPTLVLCDFMCQVPAFVPAALRQHLRGGGDGVGRRLPGFRWNAGDQELCS